jgi:hypothetical protein
MWRKIPLIVCRSLGTAYKLMIAYNPVESFVAFAKSMSTYQESQKIRVSYQKTGFKTPSFRTALR